MRYGQATRATNEFCSNSRRVLPELWTSFRNTLSQRQIGAVSIRELAPASGLMRLQLTSRRGASASFCKFVIARTVLSTPFVASIPLLNDDDLFLSVLAHKIARPELRLRTLSLVQSGLRARVVGCEIDYIILKLNSCSANRFDETVGPNVRGEHH